QDPRHGSDPIVGKPDDQAGGPIALKDPEKRWTDAVADAAGNSVDGSRKFLVVAENAAGRLIVPAPDRQVVEAHVGHMRENLLVVGDSVLVGAQFFGIASGEAHFADGGHPRRLVT